MRDARGGCSIWPALVSGTGSEMMPRSRLCHRTHAPKDTVQTPHPEPSGAEGGVQIEWPPGARALAGDKQHRLVLEADHLPLQWRIRQQVLQGEWAQPIPTPGLQGHPVLPRPLVQTGASTVTWSRRGPLTPTLLNMHETKQESLIWTVRPGACKLHPAQALG